MGLRYLVLGEEEAQTEEGVRSDAQGSRATGNRELEAGQQSWPPGAGWLVGHWESREGRGAQAGQAGGGRDLHTCPHRAFNLQVTCHPKQVHHAWGGL